MHRSCTVDEFRKHANELSQDHIGSTAPMPANFVEAEYWRQRSMSSGKPFYVEYGNDVEGSAFLKSDVPSVAGTRWNLQVQNVLMTTKFFLSNFLEMLFQ